MNNTPSFQPGDRVRCPDDYLMGGGLEGVVDHVESRSGQQAVTVKVDDLKGYKGSANGFVRYPGHVLELVERPGG